MLNLLNLPELGKWPVQWAGNILFVFFFKLFLSRETREAQLAKHAKSHSRAADLTSACSHSQGVSPFSSSSGGTAGECQNQPIGAHRHLYRCPISLALDHTSYHPSAAAPRNPFSVCHHPTQMFACSSADLIQSSAPNLSVLASDPVHQGTAAALLGFPLSAGALPTQQGTPVMQMDPQQSTVYTTRHHRRTEHLQWRRSRIRTRTWRCNRQHKVGTMHL